MTPPEIELLLSRMLWPVWQVRWEAARALAGLIEAGDADAASGLGTWISERAFESEAATGLSVIHAFDLARHFDGQAVAAAVKAPSHLSDALLNRAFGLPASKGYGFSRETPDIGPQVAAYFRNKIGQAIPSGFHNTFEKLQFASGLPFLARWEYEWQCLQMRFDAPLSSAPHWFTWEDSGGIGYFDQRQREVYLSAYLRTLAFACDEWGMDDATATGLAMEVSALNPGLSKLEFGERPAWTHALATSTLSVEALADHLWKAAEADCLAGRSLLAVRAVDIVDKAFVEIEIDLVGSAGPWVLPARPDDYPPLDRDWLEILDPHGGVIGPVVPTSKHALQPSFPMTFVATPETYARWHMDLYPQHLLLASPSMFSGGVSVEPRSQGVGLRAAGQDVSETRVWNTAWAPTKPAELTSRIGRTTDVRSTELRAFCAQSRVRTRRLAYVRIGRRTADYQAFEPERHVVWLDPA